VITRVDHVAASVARLLSQWRDLKGVAELTRSYARAIQETEDFLLELLALDWDTLPSFILDQIGTIVRQGRGITTTDAAYRLALRTRIAVNRSHGRARDIVAITRLATPDGTVFVYEERYPMAMHIRLIDAYTAELALLLFSFLNEARNGGARLEIWWSEVSFEETFHFQPDDGADPEARTEVTYGWDNGVFADTVGPS